ncbi:response regulator, partial [Anaerobutyricum hallii]|uniref:response regulator n=1 Tax=Anaerobutyricum hallii TaxID=39488 RepID=UPI003AB61172
VADKSRTEKTICLAVSPSLKKYGIPGRPRLFEVIQKVKRVNKERLEAAPGHKFIGQSFHSDKLSDPSVALAYIAAPPRMSLYMKYSTQIYQIYLRYFAPEDIHVYSIDEVFIDLTGYLTNYQMGAKELISKVIQDVLKETGITATAGIGTNLYLAKIAMDIMAKHVPADEYGVRIAYLDELTYRKKLWEHQPITDFWRVGKGYAKKLAAYQIYTMGDVARCSVGKEKEYHNEELLYKLFGINAELLIDHAWGYEPCTIADIKVYKPEAKSIGSGQVLSSAYSSEKAKAAGIDAFIAKPLFRSRLTATLRQFTSGRKEKTARNYLEELSESDYTGKRILLVEDNELNREIAGEILQMTGTKVETAENGKVAVEKVEASPKGSYDLIFMDIQMPVMNGYEATAAIRSLPGAKGKLPIVAMTANAFAEDVQLAKNTGMNGHIAKPLDMNKLNDVLKNWL